MHETGKGDVGLCPGRFKRESEQNSVLAMETTCQRRYYEVRLHRKAAGTTADTSRQEMEGGWEEDESPKA